jgi:hypothetical protein
MDILEGLDFSSLITMALGGLGLFGGTTAYLVKFKRKASAAIKLIAEVLDLLQAAEEALKDNKITKAEMTRITKEIGDVKDAYQKLIKKPSK